MKALAKFVRSDEGRFYGLVCEKYGLDPGAPFDDDVTAYNVRAAFLASSVTESDAGPSVDVQGGRVIASGFDPLGERSGR
jgi:hypothetical protein